METPELINAPGIADFRQLQGSQSIQTHPPAPDDIRTPAVYSSLADRIKSGRTRRNVHQSSPSAPSAAVYSVAEAVDAAIAPAAGPSEWHVDRQDADYTAPEGISGASNEHIHHGCSQAAPANQPPVSSTGFAQYADAAQTQVATPAKVESKRARKGSNSALLPTATELALGPDSSENALQEDTKVSDAVIAGTIQHVLRGKVSMFLFEKCQATLDVHWLTIAGQNRKHAKVMHGNTAWLQ